MPEKPRWSEKVFSRELLYFASIGNCTVKSWQSDQPRACAVPHSGVPKLDMTNKNPCFIGEQKWK
jgi:hypothetical protein